MALSSLRLDYGEQDDPLEANVRELMDKFFLPLGLIGTVRYKVGMQTFVIEASYQQPLLLEQKLYSGWQLQAGLSYDLRLLMRSRVEMKRCPRQRF